MDKNRTVKEGAMGLKPSQEESRQQQQQKQPQQENEQQQQQQQQEQANNREKLEKLNCAFIEKLETLNCSVIGKELWTWELIYKKGNTRLSLLEWLLEQINGEPVIIDENPEARIQILTEIFADCGYCSPEDYAFIEGSEKGFNKRQVSFLLDLSELAEESLVSSGCLNEKVSATITFTENISRDNDLESIFTSECVLVPPDIKKELPERILNQDQLKKMYEKIKSELYKTHAKLLKMEHCGDESAKCRDAELQNHNISQLISKINDCTSLMECFNQKFALVLEPWSDRVVPETLGIEPAAESLNKKLNSLLQILESVDKMQENDMDFKKHLSLLNEELAKIKAR